MSESKPKRVLSEEQKAKMKAALEAKRADPVWQEEQKRKREEKKAAKAAGGGDAPAKKDDSNSSEKKDKPIEKVRRQMKCSVCNEVGHTKRKCPSSAAGADNAGEKSE